MAKVQSPPTMQSFPDVYVDALNRLQGKINDEEASIQVFEQNNTQLNDLLNGKTGGPQIKDEKQFVFKINLIEGVFSQNPVFQLHFDTGEEASINFQEFDEGDAMFPVQLSSTSITVKILNEITKKVVYSFNINLSDFGNKKRQIKQSTGDSENSRVLVEYEGQIIFNQTDYHNGLLFINSQKIETSKEYKYEYTKMRDELLGVFRDQNLKTSVVRSIAHAIPHQLGASNTKFDSLHGNVLRNSQVRSGIGAREVIVNDSGVNQPPSFKNSPSELGVYNSGNKTSPGFIEQSKVLWNPFVTYLFYVNCALLLVSFFVNWNRASILSMVMAIVYVTWYLLKDEYESLLPPLFLLIGYVLAFTFDLTWLITSSRHLWNSGVYIHDGSLTGIDKFMIVMSYFIIFIELAAAIICGLLVKKGMFTDERMALSKPPMDLRF